MKTVPLTQKVISPFLYSIVSGALIAHGHNLFLKTTPRKLLTGHHINIFATASELLKPFSVFGIKEEDLLPTSELPNNAFGILNGKNNTPTGPFEMNTGLYDQSKYGYIISYKGEKKMHKWGSDVCNRIYGTDGAQYPPFRSKKDKLPIFNIDVCRTLYIMYAHEAEFKGIPVWKMKLDPKIFEPPTMNKDNECYCPHLKKRPERCSIRGTMDLTGCVNAPLVLSAPHFMGTEPNLADLVEGMEPDKNKHEFFMYFEPRLALPVFAYGRLQLNIRVERTSFLRGFDQVRNAFIPFVWVEESGGVDDFLATVLKVILVYVIDGSQSVSFFLMIVGWLMFVISFFYGVFCTSRRLHSEERLYSDQKLAHIDSDAEDDGVDGVAREGSSSETSNLRTNMEMRSSAPALEKESEALPSAYTPVYRKTTITMNHTRSSSSKNITTTTSPTVTTTTITSSGRPLSSASAKSLPRIRDLDEIRATVPLVDKNAL